MIIVSSKRSMIHLIKKKIPIGIENFESLRTSDFYYIDKTKVKARIHDDLTYDFENSSEDNFWSILYLTGYLTKAKNETAQDTATGLTCLQIPNEEVKTIFADTVAEWFKDTMRLTDRTQLMDTLWNGNAEKATKLISDILFKTISYHNYKEDYYHAFLAGIFTGVGYSVESDKEHGEGRPDLVVKQLPKGT